MNWQEYQDAVGELYLQMDGIGKVSKSITLPDKITNQPRQVDVWLEIEAKSHKIGVLIDAKYRKDKVDVKDIEEVLSLGTAVGASKCVLVALNGWTAPAQIKAHAVGLDLKLVTLNQALDLIVPNKWFVCPECESDCVVIDCQGSMVVGNMWSLLTAGRCRECLLAGVNCWACGDQMLIKLREQTKCDCGYLWKNVAKAIYVKTSSSKIWNEVSSDVPLLDPEFADFHIRDGLEHQANGDYDLAILEFTKAIEKMPIHATPYYHRAIVYDERNQIIEAIADYTTAIEYNPEYAMAYGSRGIAYYTVGKLKEAIADLEIYLVLNPSSSDYKAIENTIQHAKFTIINQQI